MNGKMNMFQLGALHKNCSHQPRTLLLSSAAAQVIYSWRHSLPTVIACTSSSAVPFQSPLAPKHASQQDVTEEYHPKIPIAKFMILCA